MLDAPPLALYIHIPWCVRKCPYCDFNSHEQRGPEQHRAYVDALLMPMNEGGPIHRGIGYYDDQFVRTGGGWKIARRQFVPVLID